MSKLAQSLVRNELLLLIEEIGFHSFTLFEKMIDTRNVPVYILVFIRVGMNLTTVLAISDFDDELFIIFFVLLSVNIFCMVCVLGYYLWPGLKDMYPNPVKLREAFTLTHGCH